eukprot:g7976.t1
MRSGIGAAAGGAGAGGDLIQQLRAYYIPSQAAGLGAVAEEEDADKEQITASPSIVSGCGEPGQEELGVSSTPKVDAKLEAQVQDESKDGDATEAAAEADETNMCVDTILQRGRQRAEDHKRQLRQQQQLTKTPAPVGCFIPPPTPACTADSTGEPTTGLPAHSQTQQSPAPTPGTVTEPVQAVAVGRTRSASMPAPNEMYSDANLLRRESLRFDARIVSLLHELWRAVRTDGGRTITRAEYFAVFARVHYALSYESNAVIVAEIDRAARERKGTTPGNCGDDSELPADLRELLAENFASDANGGSSLDRMLFAQSFFQLTDKWTHWLA